VQALKQRGEREQRHPGQRIGPRHHQHQGRTKQGKDQQGGDHVRKAGQKGPAGGFETLPDQPDCHGVGGVVGQRVHDGQQAEEQEERAHVIIKVGPWQQGEGGHQDKRDDGGEQGVADAAAPGSGEPFDCE